MKNYKLTWLWIYQDGEFKLGYHNYKALKDICKLYKRIDDFVAEELEKCRIFDKSIKKAVEATLWEENDTDIYVKIERIK